IRSDLRDVLGLGALGLLHEIELDLVALGQRAEARALNGAVVHEAVLRAVLRRDKAEALGVVEPLHGATCTHTVLLLLVDEVEHGITPDRSIITFLRRIPFRRLLRQQERGQAVRQVPVGRQRNHKGNVRTDATQGSRSTPCADARGTLLATPADGSQETVRGGVPWIRFPTKSGLKTSTKFFPRTSRQRAGARRSVP